MAEVIDNSFSKSRGEIALAGKFRTSDGRECSYNEVRAGIPADTTATPEKTLTFQSSHLPVIPSTILMSIPDFGAFRGLAWDVVFADVMQAHLRQEKINVRRKDRIGSAVAIGDGDESGKLGDVDRTYVCLVL